MINLNTEHIAEYKSELLMLLDAANVSVSNILPSEWAEKNRMMTSDVSPIPGMFSYDNSPYTREIVDCLSPDHPARRIAVIKGAQIGFSTGVIENGIGYTISENPANILYLVGHEKLVKPSMKKVDRMIDNAKLRNLIFSQKKGVRKNQSGDTDTMKEFPGGSLILSNANHGILRNISCKVGFIDDADKMNKSEKSSGSTEDMIEQRFAASGKSMKLFYISSPELKETSIIEPIYLKGDQRKYFVPCPCCGEMINFEWSIRSEYDPNEMAGITWKLDDNGLLILGSVGYTCQKCNGFFDDRNKTELIRLGEWKPTATPSRPGYYSYHLSSLYAPTYMFGWEDYVIKYLEANPVGGPRDETKWQTFKNLVLGETYERSTETLSANQLQKNTRPYEIGMIPEKLSNQDGNDSIVMLTCGVDLNGKVDDARLDYEIVAYAESGATYSIDHGSIGSFIPKDKHPELREKMTYRKGEKNSVWPVLEELITRPYEVDSDGREMFIFITGLDTGYLRDYAYPFADSSNAEVVCLKGDEYEKPISLNNDLRTYRKSRTRNNLYLVESNKTKDILATQMAYNWDKDYHSSQPFGFMNFPTPSEGKYGYNNFFAHFEAEHKVVHRGRFVWKKKTTNHQNHLFDCRLYANVARDVFLDMIFAEMDIKNGSWSDFVGLINKNAS